MTRRIIDTSPTQPRIHDTSPTQPYIDPDVVAAALGGEFVGTVSRGGSPLGAVARLTESGKPNQAEIARREQVALSDAQMRQLGDLAAALTNGAATPTTAQVATAVLSIALRSLANASEEQRAALAQELAALANGQPGETPADAPPKNDP